MNLQVGVKVLIKNGEGAFLFLRRKNQLSTDSNGTSWDIPGGRINADEKLDQALIREVQEEIGFTLKTKPVLIAAQDILVPAKELHVVRLTYLAEEDVPHITLSDEHADHTWASLGRLDTLELEPYLAEVVDTLKH